jgi:hypothetical protein
MRTRLAVLAAVLALGLAGCPGPSGTPDAAPDAAADAAVDGPTPDAAPCAGETFLTGEYVDWDSTDSSFAGIAFATFQIEGDSNPAHMDQSSPNGRIEMCIPGTGRALIAVTSGTGDDHLAGHFIADPAVFADGRFFSLRGLTPTRAGTFFTDNGLTYDAGKGQLLVNETGTAAALSLTGATSDTVLASDDGVTWAAGDTGTYVLFPNVVVTGTPAIAGAATGAGDVPIQIGELTMTAVIGQ